MDFLNRAKQAYQISTHQPDKEISDQMESYGYSKREVYPKWEAISKLPRVERGYGETEEEAVKSIVSKFSK